MSAIDKIYSLFKKGRKIITDSRSIEKGCIFLALKGASFNGNDFAKTALDQGAAYAVVDEGRVMQDERFILVDDGLKALQDVANLHRRSLTIPVLAITGSNGKTTTKELVRNVLSKKFNTLATKGNLNNHIGVPLTLLEINPGHEFAIIEMGANHQKEIELLCQIALPDYGLITNIGKAHLEGFGGIEGVKKGKGELYDFIAANGKAVFVNAESHSLMEMLKSRNFKEVVTYGKSESCYCKGKLENAVPVLEIEWKCANILSRVKTSLIGEYNFENVLSAICIGNYFGVKKESINEAISEYVPDNSRSQLITKGSNQIILDAYNANPTSMEAALNNLVSSSAEKKYIFIGDMAELGDESSAEHKKIISLLTKINAEQIILVGKNFGEFADQIASKHFINSVAAYEWLKSNRPENALILIKGSRSTKMEKLLEAL